MAIARKLGKRSAVKDYMIISAYGLVLIFISNQAILLAQNVPYPPFGFMAASFMGLSSYMLLVGIYSSAISVAEDSKLRQTIRDITTKELRLLDNIGTAQMVQEIQKTVISVTKRTQETMTEETGVESSLTEEDIKKYLEQVIIEVKEKATDNK